jgi:hypothetical protein
LRNRDRLLLSKKKPKLGRMHKMLSTEKLRWPRQLS